MIVEYTNCFVKDIKTIKDKKILNQLKEFIELVKCAPNLRSFKNIHSVKQLKGYKNNYRSRIRNYRAGIEVKNNIVTFARFLHRKDIYKYFPILNWK